jgi:NADH dehydrogenase
MKQTKIVIVGGGFAGVKTALELVNKPGWQVQLISTHMNFEYHGALYRSATGHSPMEVVIPLKTIFKRAKNVEIILDTIVGINPTRKELRSETGDEYHYDTVVLALGNDVNYFGIDGMDKHSFAMTTVPQTIALRNQLVQLFKQPGSTPTIAIVGAGPTGVELAGELQEFAGRIADKYRSRVAHPKVILIEGGDRVLPMLDPVLTGKAYKRLQKLGVELQLSTKVNACEPGKICMASGDIEADAIIWTAGSKAVNFYAEHPRAFKLERGRVLVDRYMRAMGHDDIYVLGDNANTRFSGMAQTALHDAKFVARNLVRATKGVKPVAYRNWHPIYVVPIGDKWAVLQTQKSLISGYRGWLIRRQADRWIFRNFLPYKQAIKQWRQGNRQARY